MVGDRDRDRDLFDRGFPGGDASDPAALSATGRSLMDRAAALRLRLAQLAEERMLAREWGLADDPAYAEDLNTEVDTTREAYAGAVITQLALLRAGLDGALQG